MTSGKTFERTLTYLETGDAFILGRVRVKQAGEIVPVVCRPALLLVGREYGWHLVVLILVHLLTDIKQHPKRETEHLVISSIWLLNVFTGYDPSSRFYVFETVVDCLGRCLLSTARG